MNLTASGVPELGGQPCSLQPISGCGCGGGGGSPVLHALAQLGMRFSLGTMVAMVGEDLAGGGRGIGWLSGAMAKNGYRTYGIVKQMRAAFGA